MKAIILEKVGAPIEVRDIDPPKEKEGCSIVKLESSALNHRDVWITKGMYPGIITPVILGSDGAGTIGDRKVIINPGLDWGDCQNVQSDNFQVLGMPVDGTFAEYISIENKYIYDTPDHLTMEEAAALPLAGMTAYRVLISRCKVQKTDRVLVTGTGGGVALFTVQLAVAMGCEVYVTSGSDDKIEKAIRLGAMGGWNYKNQDWYKNIGLRFDVIIDSAGGEQFQNLIKVCKPGARIGFYGATLGKYNNINPQILFWRQVSLLGSTMGSDFDFKNMLDYVSTHKICTVVDEVIKLRKASIGFDKMKSGSQFGKIVFTHS